MNPTAVAPRMSQADVSASDGLLERVLAEVDASTRREGKTVVVMPAYNAAQTLRQTLADLPAEGIDEVILVDDCSTDGTAELARELGLTVVEHTRNGGYGANQKTCYREALRRGADYVVMVHPDYQYDSRTVMAATEFLKLGICDVILGSRIRTRREALEGGMPVYKYLANRMLTIVENIVFGQNLGEWHSGFRAYSREVLETVPFHHNSNDFVFDSEFLAQSVHFGFRIGDVPVPVRYFSEASSISFRRSMRYGCATLGVMARYVARQCRLASPAIFERDRSAGEETSAPADANT